MIERSPNLTNQTLLEQSFLAVLMNKTDIRPWQLDQALLAVEKPTKGSSFDQALEIIGNSQEAVGFMNLDVLTQAQVCASLAAKISQRERQPVIVEPLAVLQAGEIPAAEKGSRRFLSRLKEAVLGIGRERIRGLVLASALVTGAIMLVPNIEKSVLLRGHITGGSYYDGYDRYYGAGPYNGYATETSREVPTAVRTPEPVIAAPVATLTPRPVVPTVSPSPSPKADLTPTRPAQTPEARPQLARTVEPVPVPVEEPAEEPSEVIDEVTMTRAGIVGSYLELIQQLADQGITEAGEFLDKDLDSIDPSVREAARLRVQFAFEKLANQKSADENPLAFDETVNDPQWQEELRKLSYDEVVLDETVGLPQYELPAPQSEEQFIAQIAHLVRNQKTLGPILRVMSQLFTQDPERAPDLIRIAAIIGEREDAVDPSQIVHAFAQYYGNRVGGGSVLKVIVANKLDGTDNFI